MKQRANGRGRAKGGDFLAHTVTLPVELSAWARRRSAEPAHAGNMSSYVRGLILEDARRQDGGKVAGSNTELTDWRGAGSVK
jgi:hypothetical protein